MDSIFFENLEELRNRLKPALKTRVSSFLSEKIDFINEDVLWDILSFNYWKNADNLELCDMVDQILNIDSYTIVELYMKTLKK